ncbi:Bacterial type II secretion system protein F domain protein [Pigmentiphaga humi]|uniref:Bacterial type II secretion system protein F domain protein n=1 Tax=Pigmentiphaga humi TaxID=2478468 RepID=A0A3P4B682_9BURK|nr:type II secretion system F family protein [Pigmentiphaga humi]VCU71582.1 Bacterial type II secretion system protein F domain protein [Pigmentiphaga humi]
MSAATSLLVGMAVAAAVMLAYFLLADSPAARGTVEAPPGAFRLAWALVCAAGHYCRPWLSWQRRRRLESLLVRAGLRHGLAPIHILGAQVLCAAAGGAIGGAVAVLADAGPLPGLASLATGASAGVLYPRLWLAGRVRRRRTAALRALPFVLDMATLCVEAGLHVGAALQHAAQKGPPGPLRDELRRMLGDVRAGVPRAQALRDMADRLDVVEVRAWVAALAQADTLGMSLAPILRAQSDQRRSERFLRAERLAMEAPVKMLLPLVACIFPCSFVVIGFPIVVKLMEPGW